MDSEASQPGSGRWRERVPLALVIVATVANAFTVLVAPPLHGHQDRENVAFFFRVEAETATRWLGRSESLVSPLRRSAKGPRGERSPGSRR